LVWPVRVQGDGAAEQVAEAIAGFDALPRAGGPVPRPDLLIVARGGGSLEDLMAFNEEAVVRAVAACSIPVISAVGHETDTTLVDFVADRRAPTPTGAAEMAVPVRLDLVARISELSTRQREAMRRALRDRAEGLVGLSRGLPDLPALLEDRIQRLDDVAARLEQAPGRLLAGKSDGLAVLAAALPHPGTVIHLKAAGLQTAARALTTAGRATLDQAAARLDRTAATLRPTVLSAEVTQASQRVSELSGRLDRAFALHRERASTRLSGLGDRLENVSYHRVLERGYAVLRSEDGRVVSKQAGIGEGTALTASLQDGSLAMVVTDGGASPKPKPEARSKPRRPSPKAARQTSLFD
ncbi:MAG: exodeoxyribonuclease VII large subunit, partial [Rhodospirillaceae bacterium]